MSSSRRRASVTSDIRRPTCITDNHNGQFDTLDSIIDFYIEVSDQSRAGTLRNGDIQLQGIALKPGDVVPLMAFLKSLNEDYQ